ncbi:alpha/beta fold hydrolase [Paenibacillus aurantiacus]|uniref:Alpha/beta fold hydrolase n=1 Tax=Paenibacillus aurantiacus TaxID=1936118 RepID=A0ABV5KUK2_9BACL
MIRNIRLSSSADIEVGLAGAPDRPVVMLPVAKKSVEGPEADNLKLWGVDPDLGKHFVEGLADAFQVLYFDYESYLFAHPVEQLTAERVVQDLLHIADAMQVKSFSYYGYSWLALAGLQLAIRTDRLDSLIMGGFPPYEGPYREMLIVTKRTHEQALRNQQEAETPAGPSDPLADPQDIDWDNIKVTIRPEITKQFVTMYESLADFDDRLIQQKLQHLPRLAFAGEHDTIVYGEPFGGVTVDIAGALKRNRTLLAELGWKVEIMAGSGMDHTKAMQPAAVLPLIKPWLMRHANVEQ